MTGFAIAAVVFVPMLVEAALAARNERRQRARGGIEPPGDVYSVMRLAYPAAFLVMILDGAADGGATASGILAGAVLFGAAKALKWWAIATLGGAWTFRVLVVPGVPLVATGPYRFLRHPNYVAVVGEFVGVALMTGSTVAAPIATFCFGLLLWRRVTVERRALDAILRRD